jgi:RimJ/RimL family protein N-acetyltransferase
METRNPVSFPNTIPLIETDHLTLRAVTPDDRAAVFALFADPRVAVPTHMAPFEGIEQADELIAFFGQRFAAKGGIRWGLTLKGDDTLIGTAGFPGIDDETYRASIGYNLAYARLWPGPGDGGGACSRRARLRATPSQPYRGHDQPRQHGLDARSG